MCLFVSGHQTLNYNLNENESLPSPPLRSGLVDQPRDMQPDDPATSRHRICA